MNTVRIDVSKGNSIAVALRSMGEVVVLPKEYPHTEASPEQLPVTFSAWRDTHVVMEAIR